MWIGIDFGTTNTVAAVADGGGAPRILPLDSAASDPATLRTLLYIERDHTTHYGADAIATYFRQNVGRMPRYTKQWIGMIDIEIGDVVVKGYEINAGPTAVDVFADVDADAPGRLLHALKGPLATSYLGTKVFGRYLSLEELVAEFLTHVRERIAAVTHQPIDGIVLGRPVVFAGAASAADNERAERRLEAAAQLAGFERVHFELEPIAAGLAIGAADGSESMHTLVFDFGGGTLDIAVLRHESDGQTRVLATGGIGIAGDHFDQTVFRRAIVPWLGSTVRWGRQRLNLPGHILAALGDWQDIPALATPHVLAFLREAQGDCSDPIRLHALEDFVFRGHAYAVYDRIERAKAALSRERFTVVDYDSGAIDLWQPLTRMQFESFIATDRRAIRDVVLDTVQRAGLAPRDIGRVVRTGGSSSIPCFIELLSGLFERARVVEESLFTSVAAGLAVRASQLA